MDAHGYETHPSLTRRGSYGVGSSVVADSGREHPDPAQHRQTTAHELHHDDHQQVQAQWPGTKLAHARPPIGGVGSAGSPASHFVASTLHGHSGTDQWQQQQQQQQQQQHWQ